MLILGLQGSPRKRGNTDSFMTAFMNEAARAGASVKTIQAARAGVVPCKGCGYCETHGTCVIADDPMSTDIYGLIRQADLVVAASPVYFYGISAQLKVLIDRCQTLWSRKYIYQLKDPLAATRKGLLFSVAASRGQQLFDGVFLTAKYFFDAIDAQLDTSLIYRGIEAKGAISQHEGVAADIDAAIQKSVSPLVKRKKILFVSPNGACRSPMAAAMAQRNYGDRIRSEFAGWSPANVLREQMVEAMARTGVDLGYRRPQSTQQAFPGTAPDMVIAIGDDADKDELPGVKTIYWPLAASLSAEDGAMDRLHLDMEAHIHRLSQVLD
jgi:multimeric flavodoxin WrbA